jgi:hypothetical protein
MRPLYDKKYGLSMLLVRLECIITSLIAGCASSFAAWPPDAGYGFPAVCSLFSRSQNNAVGL